MSERHSKPSKEHDHEDELEEDYHPHGDAKAKSSTGDQAKGDELDDFVEETSRDSFPASDPPAW